MMRIYVNYYCHISTHLYIKDWMMPMYDLDDLMSSKIKEIVFVKIKNGRYKLIVTLKGSGILVIPQKDICTALGLLYDESCDSLIISNIRYKNSIITSITDRRVKVIMI